VFIIIIYYFYLFYVKDFGGACFEDFFSPGCFGGFLRFHFDATSEFDVSVLAFAFVA